MIVQPFSYFQQPVAAGLTLPFIRSDANAASISLALPFNYFAGSFGMSDVSSDVSANVRGSGTNLPVNWTGSGAYWPTASYIAATGSGYFESLSKNGTRYPAWPGNAAPFSIGTSDVTIESWLNYSSTNTYYTYWWFHPVSISISWQYPVSKWRVILETPPAGGPQAVFDSSAVTMNANQWYHLAFVRKGSGTNNCALWFNGNRIIQGTNTFNYGADVNYPARISQLNSGTAQERYQDFRYYKGVAVYDPANSTITPQQSIVVNA